MKLHLDIDCTSLDDLKSARATIDRLIQEVESKQKEKAEVAQKFLRGKADEIGKKTIEAMREVLNPPLRKPVHYAPHGPNKIHCGASSKEPYTKDPQKVTCKKCMEMSPGLWDMGSCSSIVTDDATGEKLTLERLEEEKFVCPKCGPVKWYKETDKASRLYQCLNCYSKVVKAEPSHMDDWKCVKCGKVNDLNAGDVCSCGYRSDGRNMRTRSEVLKLQNTPHRACCNRFADQMSCDCLETALPDDPPSRIVSCPKCGFRWTLRGIMTQTKPYVCNCGHNMKCDECGSINCRQPSH